MTRPRPEVGQIWRRKESGRLVRVTRVLDYEAFFDVEWESLDKPRRIGSCYDTYWFRNNELMAADA